MEDENFLWSPGRIVSDRNIRVKYQFTSVDGKVVESEFQSGDGHFGVGPSYEKWLAINGGMMRESELDRQTDPDFEYKSKNLKQLEELTKPDGWE